MEFKNRQATNPGRVTLRNVSTGATATYDITMADTKFMCNATVKIYNANILFVGIYYTPTFATLGKAKT